MKGLKQNNQPSHDNPESHVFPISLTFSHRRKTHFLIAGKHTPCSFQICYRLMLMLTHRIEANFTEIPLNICLVVVREEYIREGSSTINFFDYALSFFYSILNNACFWSHCWMCCASELLLWRSTYELRLNCCFCTCVVAFVLVQHVVAELLHCWIVVSMCVSEIACRREW